MKKVVYILVLVVFSMQVVGQTLRLSNNTVKPGETIQVNFTAPSGYASNAWIGIIPSDIQHGSEALNDQHDLSYKYLSKQTSGTFDFKAPVKEGNYDFRLHDTDNNGKEVAYVSFTVTNVPSAINNSANDKIVIEVGISANKNKVRPGETILVYFNAPPTYAENAWIGIIPSNIPHGSEAENDKYDLSYQYLKKRTKGTLEFKAPAKPGNYDFRLHDTDSNGKEIAYVSFVVTN